MLKHLSGLLSIDTKLVESVFQFYAIIQGLKVSLLSPRHSLSYRDKYVLNSITPAFWKKCLWWQNSFYWVVRDWSSYQEEEWSCCEARWETTIQHHYSWPPLASCHDWQNRVILVTVKTSWLLYFFVVSAFLWQQKWAFQAKTWSFPWPRLFLCLNLTRTYAEPCHNNKQKTSM